MRTGGRILVDNLLQQGAKLAFCVPGESYLPVLDALYDVRDRLRLIVCRQEGGAAYMAEAYGKLTGEPGIVFVTRGPGASQRRASASTPRPRTPRRCIVFIGQVGSDFADREAFQEIDYRAHVRQHRQVGGADRSRRAHSRIRGARLPRRACRAGPARWCWRCPKTC